MMSTKLKSKPNFRFKRYYKNFYKVQQKSENIYKQYIGKLLLSGGYVHKCNLSYIQRCKYPLRELIEINEESTPITYISLSKYYYWIKSSFSRRYYYRIYISVPNYFLNCVNVLKFDLKILGKLNKMEEYFNNFGL